MKKLWVEEISNLVEMAAFIVRIRGETASQPNSSQNFRTIELAEMSGVFSKCDMAKKLILIGN